MNRIVRLSTLGLIVWFVSPSPQGRAADIGTAFTYQGFLEKPAGTPVTDTCDFRFGLWDESVGGAQKGNSPQTVTGVVVTNGSFEAAIDFGGAAIDGRARWLEIEVQCPGDLGFVLLSPRVELTPAPYALRASSGVGGPNALNVTSTDRVGIGTNDPRHQLQVAGTVGTDDLITAGPGVDVRAYGATGNADDSDDTQAVHNAIDEAPDGSTIFFGAKADGTDDSAAIQAAIDSFDADGGTVLFPAGYSFTFTKALILDQKRSIRLVGTGGSMYEGSKPTLIYTGAGAPCHSSGATPDNCSFISMRSASGIELRNLNIKYTNPNFKGDLINSDWDPAVNGDSAYLQIDSCAIHGDDNLQATKAHSLVRLNKTIISTIRNTHFLGGDYAIIGRDPGYSIVIQILNSAFNSQHISAIRNADEQWLIEGNTFEPLADGSPGAYSHEISTTANATPFAHAMGWINNWFGDATAGTWIQVRTLAFNFMGNRITGPGGIGIKFEGGTHGANISGNRFEGAIQPLVFGDLSLGMGYHYGVSVTGNDFTTSGLITGTEFLVYANFSN